MTNVTIINSHTLISLAVEYILSESKKINFIKGFDTIIAFEKYINLNTNIVPDILFVENTAKVKSKIKLLSDLAKSHPEMKIIVLAKNVTKTDLIKSIRLGACGYLLFNVSAKELIFCIENVQSGNIYIQQNIKHGSSKTNNAQSNLTKREKQVLDLILEEHTTEKIADLLFVSVSTIETHRSNLFAKTGAKNLVGLIKTCYKNGLIDL